MRSGLGIGLGYETDAHRSLPFSPGQLTDLLTWHRFTAGAVFQTSSAGIPAAGAGDPVALSRDAGRGARDALVRCQSADRRYCAEQRPLCLCSEPRQR